METVPIEVILNILTISFSIDLVLLISRTCHFLREVVVDPKNRIKERIRLIGRGFVFRQMYEEAAFCYRELISLFPCSEVYKDLGLCYENMEEVVKAQVCFHKAVASSESESDRLFYLSFEFLYQEKFREAMELVQSAIKIEERPEYFHQRGYLSYKLYQCNESTISESIKDYLLLEKLPEYEKMSVVLNNLGNLYLEEGELDKSLQYLNRALEIEPRNIRAYFNRSTVWEEKHIWENAISDYNAMISLNPDSDYFLHYFKAKCLLQIGNTKEATEEARIVSFKTLHEQAVLTYISLLIKYGLFDKALIETKCLLVSISKKLTDIQAGISETQNDIIRSNKIEKVNELKKCLGIVKSLRSELLIFSFENFQESKIIFYDHKKQFGKSLPNYKFLNFFSKFNYSNLHPITKNITFSLLFVENSKLVQYCKEVTERGFLLQKSIDQQYFLAAFALRYYEIYLNPNNFPLMNFLPLLASEKFGNKGIRRAWRYPLFLCKSFIKYYDDGFLPADLLNQLNESRKMDDSNFLGRVELVTSLYID
eukprot:TRINITY_DN11824_c0_g1_i1.p1 TRINITY_DN11824_c0_g1~~TRINITY_DN11824_c0_g1_i1.p1  ORF type:complete len:539 (+),score=62.56 TRINITY_DN11824_c0_g1_i1:88-1704(+)